LVTNPVDSEQILTEVDLCVKCGYCLPHCPTYALKADEGESPRGRIALIQALLSGLVESERLHLHLDSCLACRACEAACPSDVRYGLLITSVRDIQRSGGKAPGAVNRALLHTLSHAPYSQTISSLAGFYQRFGVTSIVDKLGGESIERLNRLLPANMDTTPWKEFYPAVGEPTGRIALFTGCISRITDRSALNASIVILNRLGYDVVVPPNQGCCGAMHHNSGDSSEAEAMAQKNCDAFSNLELDAIVGVASGCISHLKEQSEKSELSTQIMDISNLLSHLPNIDDLELNPLDKRVAIHTPCSMKNVLKQTDGPFLLLRLIPGIELLELPENGLCCGAAGTYIINNPVEADILREDKIKGVKQIGAEILVTSNTGCSMHLAAGIRKDGLDTEVLHPVELLARQLVD
jgi:glycolate oxidase iron-sulfur subunit